MHSGTGLDKVKRGTVEPTRGPARPNESDATLKASSWVMSPFTQLMAINEAECDSAGQAKSGSLFDCTGFAEADGSAIDLGTWWVEPRSGEYARVTPGGEGNQAPAGPEEASAAYQEVVDARGDGEAFASCAPGIQIGAERITHNAYTCAVVAAQGELLVMIRWNENGTVASEQIDLDSVGGTGQVPE
jgi:hypothetical protein